MTKIKTYSIKGVKGEDFSLPESLTGKINMNLLSQASRVYEHESHIGFSKVKTRAEINRTTKKVYKQKGTGGARHGSRRANLFVGGGIAHGPKIEKRTLSLNKNIKAVAKKAAISLKAKRNEIILVNGLDRVTKTKEIGSFLKSIAKEFKGISRFTFVLGDKNMGARKFLKNIENVRVMQNKDLNAFAILKSGLFIIDNSIFEAKEKAKAKTQK